MRSSRNRAGDPRPAALAAEPSRSNLRAAEAHDRAMAAAREVYRRARGVVVSHPLSMRGALGSSPSESIAQDDFLYSMTSNTLAQVHADHSDTRARQELRARPQEMFRPDGCCERSKLPASAARAASTDGRPIGTNSARRRGRVLSARTAHARKFVSRRPRGEHDLGGKQVQTPARGLQSGLSRAGFSLARRRDDMCFQGRRAEDAREDVCFTASSWKT